MRFRRFIATLVFLGGLPLLAAAAPPAGGTDIAAVPGDISPGAIPLDLETALECTLRNNPALVAQRQNIQVSAEAIEVAKRFPTSLNPTLSVEVCPWVFQRGPGGAMDRLDNFITVNWAQPIELGGRRALRENIARASYSQTTWNLMQAELTALVQTFRLHQTATYRREKLAVAGRLVEFNEHLLAALRRQMDANQVSAADVVLADVESQATQQQRETARQEYVAALTELRTQIGMPQYAALAEPAGPLRVPHGELPAGEDELVQLAIEGRPEIKAAGAQVAAAREALRLARADRIPTPSIGPAYERSETKESFYGISASSPIPILNSGATLVRQREAEYCRDCVALEQMRQQVTTQVKASLVKWTQAQQSAARVQARFEPIHVQGDRMQRLYEAGQADLVKLLQVRQRWLEADNAQLDAVWQTTQAYADLLAALGVSQLLGSLPVKGEPAATGPQR